MASKIICFSGQFASGKDSSADYLAERFSEISSESWNRACFAEPVKRIYCEAFGVDMAFIEKWKRVNDVPPGFDLPCRKGLQQIGDGFRRIKISVWVDLFLKKPGNLIGSDGRYISEAKAIKKYAGVRGVNVLLWRPGYENNDPCLSESEILSVIRYCVDSGQNGPIIYDPSDPRIPVGLEYYDYFLKNDGSAEDLCSRIEDNLIPYLRDRVL